MKYCLMFVVAGASMHASESQLSSLGKCSRISRPASPLLSMASQSVAPIKVVRQEEEKSQSSMPSVQSVSAEAKETLYSLSDEIKRKAQRLAIEAKIKADASALHAYVLKNPSVIKKQILAQEPRLHDYYVQSNIENAQSRSIGVISILLIAHHDPNNKWFSTQKERDDFVWAVKSYVVNNKKNEGEISADLAHSIKKKSFLDADTKREIEMHARLDEANATIREQLAAIVPDQSNELEKLCQEEFKKQAHNICKEFLRKHSPDNTMLKDEGKFKSWVDEQYNAFTGHLASKEAFETNKKKKCVIQ